MRFTTTLLPFNHRGPVRNLIVSLTSALLIMTTAQAGEEPDRLRRRTPVVAAYERVRDSIVNISCTEKIQLRGMGLWGDIFTYPTERRSVGSGFVIHEDGYVVTNAHVVSAATELKVTLADGREYPARVIGRDTQVDLAVIKVEPKSPLVPIAMGRSDDLMIGEQTIAVGNPVGLQNTLTTGVVSALHRELEIEGRTVYRDVIQTDASINPGNSGGPLLNIVGELIGINTAIRGDAQNIGFAIPVEQLRQILPDVLDSEKLNKLQVGMSVIDADGPTVTKVRPGSPADKAGVRVGDLVTAIDGRRIGHGVDFHVSMLGRKAGDSVTVSLLRGGEQKEAKLQLTPVPKPDGRKLAKERLGLTIADVNETAGKRFPRAPERGVLVVAVEPRGPGDKAGLLPGDLLVSVDRHWVSDVDLLGGLISETTNNEPITIGLWRERKGTIFGGEVQVFAR